MRPTIPIDEDAVVWSRPAGERAGRPLVVFLHGFTGDESDWSAWFHLLPAGVVGASLRGPVAVRDRWAWFDFTAPGTTWRHEASALSAAARGVQAWIDRQDVERVALVGWSQGGALAVHLVRQRPDRYACAAVVAGFVSDARPHAGVRARRPAVWYGMGGRDDVITPAMVRRSHGWLDEHTDATLVDLPEEDHMLSEAFVSRALAFTETRLRRPT